MALIVQKYGGTSVGSPDRIRNVARRVALRHSATLRGAERSGAAPLADAPRDGAALHAHAQTDLGCQRAFLPNWPRFPERTEWALSVAGYAAGIKPP